MLLVGSVRGVCFSVTSLWCKNSSCLDVLFVAGDKPHKCDVCNKCFSRKDKLKMHMRSHTGVKPYKCKHCDYAAADSSSLNKHQRIHSNERPFKCQICPYASRNSSQLTVHLRSHTGKLIPKFMSVKVWKPLGRRLKGRQVLSRCQEAPVWALRGTEASGCCEFLGI